MADSGTKSAAGGGLSLGTILGVIFIILKLTGNITWPWIWVLAPFWIPWAIVIGILIIIGLVAVIAGGSKRRW